MSSFIARTGRPFIQVVIFGLSLSVLGLVIKAFHQLSRDRKRVQTNLLGSQLHTKAIVEVGVALVIISSFASSFVIFQSAYIMRHKLPPRLRESFPDKFAIKSMSIIALFMTPINIAQTCITATGKGHVTSSVMSDSLVQSLLAFAGESLKYEDNHTVVAYTILAWLVWVILLIGIVVEFSESKDDVTDHEINHEKSPETLQKSSL